ncbi:MAG: CRISPR-associated endoribonuclease Cas6 [Atribacterota bacterium]
MGVFLHERGSTKDSHRYTFFVFSKLFPRKARGTQQGLLVLPPVLRWVSSPLSSFVEALALALLKSGKVTLGRLSLLVEKVEIEAPPVFARRMLCETISPLVVSTGVKKGEKLHKVFLSPGDPRFSNLVKENLSRKVQAFGALNVPANITFEPTGTWRSKLVTVQGTNVGVRGEVLR